MQICDARGFLFVGIIRPGDQFRLTFLLLFLCCMPLLLEAGALRRCSSVATLLACVSLSACTSTQSGPAAYNVLIDQGAPNFHERNRFVLTDPEFSKKMKEVIHLESQKYNQRTFARVVHSFRVVNLTDPNVHATAEQGIVYLNSNTLPAMLELHPSRVQKILHHEIGHNFHTKYAVFADTEKGREADAAWRKLYKAAYATYLKRGGYPEGGYLGANIKDVSVVNDDLLATGMLSAYALVNVNEHFAVYAESLWTGTLPNGDSFWAAYDEYPAIREMTEVVVQVYQQNDYRYSLRFFRELSSKS